MKLLKIYSVLVLVVSLNASEIKPFGKFKFGDSFTPIYNKLCKIKGIESIIFRNDRYTNIPINEFCKNKNNAIKMFENNVLSNSNQFARARVDGFKNILAPMYYLIKANYININGVKFTLSLYVGGNQQFYDEGAVGSYLKAKNDVIVINDKEGKIKYNKPNTKYLLPLSLHKITLVPKNVNNFRAVRKGFYDIFKNKYIDKFNALSNYNKKRFDKYMELYVKGDSGTTMLSLGNREITYESTITIQNKLFFNNYLRNRPKDMKNDNSGGL